MMLAHRFGWHYMRTLHVENDTMLKCDWCGISVVTERRNSPSICCSGVQSGPCKKTKN